MNEERRKVLDMLSEGKITAEEAERLLEVLEDQANSSTDLKTSNSALPRYLYVQVDPKEGVKDSEQVKITVPLTLLKAGISLLSLLPKKARDDVEQVMDDKGFDFDFSNLKPEEMDALVTALEELEVNVDTPDTTVRVYVG